MLFHCHSHYDPEGNVYQQLSKYFKIWNKTKKLSIYRPTFNLIFLIQRLWILPMLQCNDNCPAFKFFQFLLQHGEETYLQNWEKNWENKYLDTFSGTALMNFTSGNFMNLKSQEQSNVLLLISVKTLIVSFERNHECMNCLFFSLSWSSKFWWHTCPMPVTECLSGLF